MIRLRQGKPWRPFREYSVYGLRCSTGIYFDLDVLDCVSLCAVSTLAEVACCDSIREMKTVLGMENRTGMKVDNTRGLK